MTYNHLLTPLSASWPHWNREYFSLFVDFLNWDSSCIAQSLKAEHWLTDSNVAAGNVSISKKDTSNELYLSLSSGSEQKHGPAVKSKLGPDICPSLPFTYDTRSRRLPESDAFTPTQWISQRAIKCILVTDQVPPWLPVFTAKKQTLNGFSYGWFAPTTSSPVTSVQPKLFPVRTIGCTTMSCNFCLCS